MWLVAWTLGGTLAELVARGGVAPRTMCMCVLTISPGFTLFNVAQVDIMIFTDHPSNRALRALLPWRALSLPPLRAAPQNASLKSSAYAPQDSRPVDKCSRYLSNERPTQRNYEFV
jgi:hypothetical protein